MVEQLFTDRLLTHIPGAAVNVGEAAEHTASRKLLTSESDVEQQLSFHNKSWLPVCIFSKTAVLLLLSGCSPQQLVRPAQQQLVRQLQDCVLQSLPAGSTVVPLSSAADPDKVWLQTLLQQRKPETLQHRLRSVELLNKCLFGEFQASKAAGGVVWGAVETACCRWPYRPSCGSQ